MYVRLYSKQSTSCPKGTSYHVCRSSTYEDCCASNPCSAQGCPNSVEGKALVTVTASIQITGIDPNQDRIITASTITRTSHSALSFLPTMTLTSVFARTSTTLSPLTAVFSTTTSATTAIGTQTSSRAPAVSLSVRGGIIASAVLGLVAVALFTILIWFCYQKRQNTAITLKDRPKQIDRGRDCNTKLPKRDDQQILGPQVMTHHTEDVASQRIHDGEIISCRSSLEYGNVEKSDIEAPPLLEHPAFSSSAVSKDTEQHNISAVLGGFPALLGDMKNTVSGVDRRRRTIPRLGSITEEGQNEMQELAISNMIYELEEHRTFLSVGELSELPAAIPQELPTATFLHIDGVERTIDSNAYDQSLTPINSNAQAGARIRSSHAISMQHRLPIDPASDPRISLPSYVHTPDVALPVQRLHRSPQSMSALAGQTRVQRRHIGHMLQTTPLISTTPAFNVVDALKPRYTATRGSIGVVKDELPQQSFSIRTLMSASNQPCQSPMQSTHPAARDYQKEREESTTSTVGKGKGHATAWTRFATTDASLMLADQEEFITIAPPED